MKKNINIAFIIGSPRSGTSILSKILNTHHAICERYEPYFVWDRYFRNAPDDQRTEQDCSPQVREQIFKDFYGYQKKTKCTLIIDKSPRNSLKIPFILKIFPGARFIHILRDGRDTVLSINKEWKRFNYALGADKNSNSTSPLKAVQLLKNFLRNQKSIKFMIKALYHETHGHINKNKHLNRLRWDKQIGFGPRFKNWRDVYHNSSLLEFNAHQWLKCIENIRKSQHKIPKENFLEVRYEELIARPRMVISRILDFLDIEKYEDFFKSIPQLKSDNSNKWEREFSEEQLQQIMPIIADKLAELDYLSQKNNI